MGEFWRKLTRLGRRDELAERLHEELQFHVDRKGSEVGNRARILEQAYEVWSLGRAEQVVADLRYAARALGRSPAFFALAAIGTGLGVAAITAVVSVSDTVLVRSMPYRDADRLVVVSDQLLKLDFPRFPISIANFLDYRAQNRVFEDVAAFEPRALTVTMGGRAERVAGMMASANLLAVLGGAPARGRWFDPPENHRGHMDVAVVSYSYWQSHLGSAKDVLGQSLVVNDQPYRVVGVLQRGFAFRLAGDAPEIWLPAGLDAAARDAGNLQAVARLKQGVTLASAQAQMHVVAADLKQRYHAGMGPHGEDGGYDAVAIPLREELYGAVRPTLYALAGASAILLLLGLANTALLWMGRAAARRKEAAVRLALGASRWRVGQQLVLEALVPSLVGGAMALLMTLAALAALNSAPPGELATADRFALDYRVFGFALMLSATAGVLFGALPVGSVFRAGVEGRALMQDRGGIAVRPPPSGNGGGAGGAGVRAAGSGIAADAEPGRAGKHRFGGPDTQPGDGIRQRTAGALAGPGSVVPPTGSDASRAIGQRQCHAGISAAAEPRIGRRPVQHRGPRVRRLRDLAAVFRHPAGRTRILRPNAGADSVGARLRIAGLC
jgi:hypothetical protein